MNRENRYRVEITIPVWVYMEDEYMYTLDTSTQEDIVNKLADDLETGALSFMDVMHWRIAKDNPSVRWDEEPLVVDDRLRVLWDEQRSQDPDEPIDYYPTGR